MTQNHGDTETAAREALDELEAVMQMTKGVFAFQTSHTQIVLSNTQWHAVIAGLRAALRSASPGKVTVTETIQKHPDYERVRKIWDDALKISEGHCRDLDEKLERETGRVVEYSNRISVLLSEKADLTAALSARPTAPDAVAAEEDKK